MTQEELTALAREMGFEHFSPLDPATIQLKQDVRDMCATNSCGRYGKCWSCPPACGDLDDCRAQIAGCTGGILVQSVGDVEDGFDFEAMMEIEETHKERFTRMHHALLEKGGKILALGAGCCTLCPTCTCPDAPCRFPEKRISSMEAFGILVLEVCKANGMSYYYGPDKMAYTSCFLWP